MLNNEQIQNLTPDQILQLDNALETFNCRAVICDLCPMYYRDRLKIDEHKVSTCLCIYIAARALEIKSKSIT